MNHLPHEIWKLIAEHGKPDTPLGRALLGLTEPELDEAMDKLSLWMKTHRYPNKVILAYQTVLMLYMENAAISRTISLVGDPQLRQALPEVLTRREAVTLAANEFRLTQKDQRTLYEILPNRKPAARCAAVTKRLHQLTRAD